RQQLVEEVACGPLVAGLEQVPDLDLQVDHLAGGHGAVHAAAVFGHEIAAGHSAHHSLESVPGEPLDGADVVAGGNHLLLDIAHPGNLHQLADGLHGHRAADGGRIVLDPDW